MTASLSGVSASLSGVSDQTIEFGNLRAFSRL
jgi:hypothetical protein